MTSLIVKAQFGPHSTLSRRVTFPNLDAVYIEAFREKIQQCFSISGDFRIAYRDDDGDENEIATADDLLEAISFFQSDEEDQGGNDSFPIPGSFADSPSEASGSNSTKKKVVMRLYILVDYDGPNLSESGNSQIAGSGREQKGKESTSNTGGSFERVLDRFDSDRSLIGQATRAWREAGIPSSASSSSAHPGPSNPYHASNDPSSQQYSIPPSRWQLSPPISSNTVSPTGTHRARSNGSASSSYSGPPGQPANIPPPSYPTPPASSAGQKAASSYTTTSNGSSIVAHSRATGSSSSSNGNTPSSAPPTYKSDSSNGSKSGSISNGIDRLHLPQEDTSSGPITPNEDASLRRPTLFQSESMPEVSTSTAFAGFLADLSKSRMNWPNSAPSVLSAVPADLLRCCGCQKVMVSFRYICSGCGPILPEQELSDDGTHIEPMKNGVGFVEDREGEGVKKEVTGHQKTGDGVDMDDETESYVVLDDPLGVNGSSEASKGKKSAELSTTPTAQNPEAGGSVPLTTAHLNGSAEPILHNSMDSRRGEEDRGGFELCSDCIETEGVKHATAMRKLAKERGSGMRVEEPLAVDETEEDASVPISLEVSHAFAEVMKMGTDQGWTEVDYEDDVHCSTCGIGPVQTNRFKCLSCARFELCLSCYRNVEDIHPVHSFLAIPDRPARPRPRSISDSSLLHHASGNPEDVRLAFIRAEGLQRSRRGLPLATSDGDSSSGPRSPLASVRHEGVLCFGCLQDIVGARYSCSVCAGFDLCSKCESLDPPITSPDNFHTLDHILLKINVPISQAEILDEAADRVRTMTRGSSSYRHPHPSERDGSQSGSSRHDRRRPPSESRRLPLDWIQNYGSSAIQSWLPGHYPPDRLAPNQNQRNPSFMRDFTEGFSRAFPHHGPKSTVVHHYPCDGCSDQFIVGTRWLCAQCPTAPRSYNLCSKCEPKSHLLHDALHCFIRLPFPLTSPLPALSQLLPIMYDPTAPAPQRGVAISSRSRFGFSNSNEHDESELTILHSNVFCDICMEAIRGPWMRCCQCNAFDCCEFCLERLAASRDPSFHPPSHVFVKFIRRVDISLLSDLTRISTDHPRPFLNFQVYA